MNYEGKLYGKTMLGYFDTGYTSKDWDEMENTIKELKSELSAIKNEKTVNERPDKICPICGNTGQIMFEDYSVEKCKRCYPDG